MEQTLAWRAVPWKTRLKAFLERLLVGLMWLGFIWFATRVYATSPLGEVIGTLAWLGKILTGYLIALVCWIAFNIVQHRVRRGAEREAPDAIEVREDYFGRRVIVALGSSFSDRHVAVEMVDGRKVYSTQTVAPEPVPAEPVTEPARLVDGEREQKAKHVGAGTGG